MTQQLKFVGPINPTAIYEQGPIVGHPGTWALGENKLVSDADAALLLATGYFAADFLPVTYNPTTGASSAGGVPVNNQANHTSAINAAILPNGKLTTATTGVLQPLAGDTGNVSVSGGAIVMPNGAGAAYIPLLCDDVVQRMTAKIFWPTGCTGVITFVIPAAGANFPGVVGGSGTADAAVHAAVSCYNGSANSSVFNCGGYGTNAGVITGQVSADFSPQYPLQNNTRTVELTFNKVTGRVTMSIETEIVLDYFDVRGALYCGPYGIFEFFPTGQLTGTMPKLLSIEASSVYKEPNSASLVKYGGAYLNPAYAFTNSWANTGLAVNPSMGPGNNPGGSSLILVSAFITQTSGDTSFRLTDGTYYSGNQIVARGAFTGRVSYIEQLGGSNNGAAIQLQAQNSAGVGSMPIYTDVGRQAMVSLGVTRL